MILSEIQRAWDAAKPFQVEDADFLARNGSCVLGHKTGLGKTVIAMLAWSKWGDADKGLILGTLGSMATWGKLLPKWAGVQPKFMQGSGPWWDEFFRAKKGVYMSTYMSFLYAMRDVPSGKFHTDVLINDELHRVMRTRNKIWAAQKRLAFEHYTGMSATWASRGPQDCFPVLNLVNRQTFPSYWRYVETWCHVIDTQWGKEITGVRNVENLRKLMASRYYRSRTWKEVGNQFRPEGNMDPVIRRAEYVPMSKQQHKLIDQLRYEMVAELGPNRIVTPNSVVQLTRMLQLAISPRILLPDAEFGAIVDWVVEKVSDDPHTVIFCPFREGLDVIREALLKDGYPAHKIFIFRGGMKPDDINATVDLWKKTQGVALGTIAFAQSFDLDTTETAYMVGFDWDPNNNIQAEGRLRRLDSILTSPCACVYVVPEQSDYQHVVAPVLDGKVMTVRQFLEGYDG
jgi:hypothetical protein